MGRKEQRIKNKLEKNPIKECLSIQKKFYPRLFNRFNEVADPRNSSYIDYSNRVMLGTLYFKSICSVPSMQSMTNYFNKEEVVSNIYNILGDKEKEYLPHYVTLNEYLERLNPKELENIQHDIVYRMIRRKTFNDAEYSTKKLSDEEIKQDCESKAFLRLSQKLKKAYPRLPICILADGLYVSEKVINRCKEYNWDYIIRYKEGSASSIAQEYNANAQKCHYLMEQIADFIKQLYEYFFLNKNEIKKKQKNISSDLLASISKQLTTEDISIIDMHTVAYN